MPSPASNTPNGIIRDAMFEAGYLARGELPNSEDISDNFRRLTDMINLWQTQGLKLFLNETLSVTLTAGQGLYTFGPLGTVPMVKPMRVLQANVLNTDNIRRPLNTLSYNEWMTLSQTNNLGMISSYFVDKQADLLKVHFWNVPDATEALNTVEMLTQVAAPNVINLEDDTQFPQEWRIALLWGLADEIAGGQPQAIMDRCSQRAMAYRDALEDWDVEDAKTRFTVNFQGMATPGRFR